MGNATAPVKEPVAVPQSSHHGEGLGNLFSSQDTAEESTEKQKKGCCAILCKMGFVMLCFINILISIAVIVVTVSAAIAMKMFSSDQSSKLVAMILLAVLAAASMSITIYALVAVLRKQLKPVHASVVVLLILAIIQAVILGVAVPVTDADEIKLSRGLSESFQLARQHDPRHVKLWATIQYDLKCCGVYSAEDYRNPNVPPFFAPDVTVSCCPGFDPDRSELVQERERQSCKAKKVFFEIGCRDPVLDIYRGTSRTVTSVMITLIVFEVLIVAVGIVIVRKCSKKEKTRRDGTEDKETPASPPVPEVVVNPKEKAVTNGKTKS